MKEFQVKSYKDFVYVLERVSDGDVITLEGDLYFPGHITIPRRTSSISITITGQNESTIYFPHEGSFDCNYNSIKLRDMDIEYISFEDWKMSASSDALQDQASLETKVY